MSMETIKIQNNEGFEIVYDMDFSSITSREIIDVLMKCPPDAHVRFLVKDREYEWYEAIPFSESEIRVSDDGFHVLLGP